MIGFNFAFRNRVGILRRLTPAAIAPITCRGSPCDACVCALRVNALVKSPPCLYHSAYREAFVMPPKKAGKKGAQMAPAFDAADADDHDDLQTIIAGDAG